MNMLDQKQKIVIFLLIGLAIGVMVFQYINSTKEVYSYEDSMNVLVTKENNTNIQDKDEKIIIHVTGAVKKEGIVEVKENARINDVIQAAGGITEDADLTNVNLAYIVEDGQKIYIPSNEDKRIEENTMNDKVTSNDKKEIITNEAGSNVIENKLTGGESITNINKAGLEELKLLPGIRRINCIKNT